MSYPPFPPAEARPFDVQALPVGDGHVLHVEQWGRPDGRPALLLHGGPGSGSSPMLLRGFDLDRWRVITFDQRGAGRSTPAAGLAHNTTADLAADIRRLREHLGIARWLVVGGSWGATLALVHALDAPEAVEGLLLRAVFLVRPVDVDAFFGADGGRPWRPLAALLGTDDAAQWPARLVRLLADPADPAADAAVQAWHAAEAELAGQPLDAPAAAGRQAPPYAAIVATRHAARRQRLTVLTHYLAHGCWLQQPPLLDRCAAALPTTMPALLLHGRADRICLPGAAQALAAALPQARLRWVDGAGHDPTHPAMAAAMSQALGQWLAAADGSTPAWP